MASLPRSPIFGKAVGYAGVIVSAAASLEASGVLNLVQGLKPEWAAAIAVLGSVVGWLARAPVGKR